MQLLPGYQLPEPEFSFVTADNKGNLLLTRCMRDKFATIKLAKTEGDVQSVQVFQLNQTFSDVKPFKMNSQQFTVLLAVSSSTKLQIYALSYGDVFQLVKLGMPLNTKQKGVKNASTSMFQMNK